MHNLIDNPIVINPYRPSQLIKRLHILTNFYILQTILDIKYNHGRYIYYFVIKQQCHIVFQGIRSGKVRLGYAFAAHLFQVKP